LLAKHRREPERDGAERSCAIAARGSTR
jgi:hypothetical protein